MRIRRADPSVALIVMAVLTAGVARAQPVYEKEFRAVWITNVDSDVLNSRERIAQAMDYLAANGFNTVYPVVWNKGFTLFPSQTLKAVTGVEQDPAFASQGRDPLAEIVVEAHRVGMEVIPWFEYGFAASNSQGGGPILQARPHWAARNVNSGILTSGGGFEWMDGINPEVQDFMLGMIREAVENYDVDGVQGDDRLPAMPVAGGYSDYVKALYRAEHNGQNPPTFERDFAWIQWRADKLTSFLGRWYRMVKAIDPNLTMSLSPSIYGWGLENYLQDWPTWIDSGYVDVVHPQAYPPPPRSVSQYRSIIQNMVGPTPGSLAGYIEPGQRHLLAPGLLTKAGGDLVDPARILAMVAYHRSLGVRGESYFFYEGMGSKNKYLADSLFKYVYATPAITPVRTDLWRPKATIVNEEQASLTGNWFSDGSAPGYTGTMRYALPGTGASARYDLTIPGDGTYDLYAYTPRYRPVATSAAVWRIEGGPATTINQVSTATQGWMPIGQVTATAAAGITVRINADDASDGGGTYIDGVMAILNRKLSPNTVIDIAAVSTEPAAPELPGPVRLLGNYPNPFNPATTVSFDLGTPEAVSLEIFDALGRLVSTPVRGERYAAGRHEVRFDAAQLPTGPYFYRVSAGRTVRTGSMVLVR